MIQKQVVQTQINKLKEKINKELNAGNYDNVLSLINVTASVYYSTNIEYTDVDLENALAEIAKKSNLQVLSQTQLDDNVVLFWDGFGFNSRGLAQIYIKALCKYKRVIYITHADREGSIQDIKAVVENSDGNVLYIDRRQKWLNQIHELDRYINIYKPKHLFFYGQPNDVVMTTLMYAYEGLLQRYQINLTDHAFWLGTGCLDKCIEFRDYGACISSEYRGIPREKIVKIPYYPIINFDQEFQGFPFEKKLEQKVIFSGGSLYKTMGDNNRYYHMVEHLLNKHTDAIFWYAGSGDDSELKKLIEKYPGRVYHTTERSDLFQLLQHCDMYLSTYPFCGGLMYQYAAMAGLVPLTLFRNSESGGILINQSNLGIEYAEEIELYNEAEHLLTDPGYKFKRAREMKAAVISPDAFEREVHNLLVGITSGHCGIEYRHEDTEEFRNWYLEDLSKKDLYEKLVIRGCCSPVAKYFPFEFFYGGVKKAVAKLKKCL